MDELNYDQTVEPQDYWSNSSGNAIVRRLIDKADVQTKDEIERLIAGECIEKELSQELTYDELDKKSFVWILPMRRLIRASKIFGAYFLRPDI